MINSKNSFQVRAILNYHVINNVYFTGYFRFDERDQGRNSRAQNKVGVAVGKEGRGQGMFDPN